MGAMAHKSKNKVRKLKTVHDPRGASKSQNKESFISLNSLHIFN